MNAHSLVTIGITTFNAQDTVARAVYSALAQTWANTEIVVIDDRSTDHTIEIIRALQKKNPKIRLFENPANVGVAYSRNRIVEESTGEWIVFFDDDDESHPDRIQKQMDRICAYEEKFAKGAPVVCYTARLQKYPDGHKRIEPTMGTVLDKIAPHGLDVAKRILTGNPVPDGFGSLATCAQMARTETYRALGAFDQKFRRCQDTEFNVRFALAGGHFVGIDEPLVIQTMTHGSEKTVEAERVWYKAVLQKHKDFINTYTSYDFHQKFLDAKYDFVARKTFSFLKNISVLFILYPFNTFQRFLWAIPNRKFYKQARRFYTDMTAEGHV